MKALHWLYRCLALASALFLAAACLDDITNDIDLTGNVAKIIPYSVTANSAADTKVGLNAANKYFFEEGDMLIVSGKRGDETIEGVLTLQSGASSQTASFSGNLTWKGGSGDKPADNFPLSFRLFSKDQSTEPFTAAITDDIVEAVQLFSTFAKESEFSKMSLDLEQGTAFINFDLTMEPAPTDGKYDIELFNNKTESMTSAQVQVTDGEAIFCAAFPGGTTLYQAKFSLAGVDFKFAGTATELKAGKKYTVSQTVTDQRYTPLTIEAQFNNTRVTIKNPLTKTIAYTINGTGYTERSETEINIDLDKNQRLQLYGQNDTYASFTDFQDESIEFLKDGLYTNIRCSDDCYVYGNIMSLVQPTGVSSLTNPENFATLTTLTAPVTFVGFFTEVVYVQGSKPDEWRAVSPDHQHIFNHPTKDILLPATGLTIGCYGALFAFSGISRVSELPATNMTEGCYAAMYSKCPNILSVPENLLPATTMAPSCYGGMFALCENLSNAPNLPATTLATACYSSMFLACLHLVDVPDVLPAETLAERCYHDMFSNCRLVTDFPAIAATTVAKRSCEGMFENCSSMTAAPELKATTLVDSCYAEMFEGCSYLTYIKCLATDISAKDCTADWTEGVARTGTFVRDENMESWRIGSVNGIPMGWEISPSMPSVTYPLTLQATGDGTIEIENPLELPIWYEKNGEPSEPINDNPIYIGVQEDDQVSLFGNNNAYAARQQGGGDEIIFTRIDSDVDCIVFGNIMSLIAGADYLTSTEQLTGSYAFYKLFADNSHLKTDSQRKISLPATKLSSHCYAGMFMRCFGLTDAPILPATELGMSCYEAMFAGCTSLVTPPALPATELTGSCYEDMFASCTSLTSAPALPALNAIDYCYYGMFEDCTSLTAAPDLPATRVHYGCYWDMFEGCTSLVSVPAELPAETLDEYCYKDMFAGCTSLTTAPALPAMELDEDCYSGMFKDCFNLTTAPELPAETLAVGCYATMFSGCTSLTTAPVLKATTLKRHSYDEMFNGCSNLTSITCLATDISANGSTNGWVEGVAANGTFTTASGMYGWESGDDGIPNGWTVEGRGPCYRLSFVITNCYLTYGSQLDAVAPGASYSTTVRPYDLCRLSSVIVTMGGTDITSTCYDEATHTITIDTVSADVHIEVTADPIDHFNVSYDLTNATASSQPETVVPGEPFNITIQPISPANRLTFTVTMNGEVYSDGRSEGPHTIYIGAVTGDLVITAIGRTVYSIDVSTEGCSRNNWATTIEGGNSYENTFTPYYDSYVFTLMSVEMGGTDITESSFIPSENKVYIEQVTGDLRIVARVAERGYPITQHLTHITSSYVDAYTPKNSFSAILTPDPGYTIDVSSVVVTMDGTEVKDAYDWAQRTVTLSPVTGAVEIWAEATEGAEQRTIEFEITNATVNGNVPIVGNTATLDYLATYEADVEPTGSYDAVIINVKRWIDGKKPYWEDVTSEYVFEDNQIYIHSIQDNMKVIATGTYYYNIERNLTNCNLSNGNNRVKGGQSYSTYINPTVSGGTLTVTVTMGGSDITSSCFNGKDYINIPNVTGNISITATVEGGSSYVNVLYDLKDVSSSNSGKYGTLGDTYQTTLTAKNPFIINVTHNGSQIIKEDTAKYDEKSGYYIYDIYISPIEGDISISAYTKG